ncbi:hypothetical protein B0H63DRAFT_102635 [Podospora didyma]|uniref:BTB domain-containing protein n=1 Tax=Podospora didyma TaxID=330526 RepID=A0AAE0NXJ4_9PEZI|nr:hypothetical protein B0H63DRAFT_102635 [Podospora didyma]
MAIPVHQIDSKGDILLCFPGSVRESVESPQGNQAEAHDPWSPAPRAASISRANPAETPEDDRHFMHGNIHEEVGPISLQVSSSVLCLISPVFSAMLHGPMAEGQGFRAPNSPRPFPITLPEDNGHLFQILANVVHHRSEAIPVLPSTADLVALAGLADKYDCVAALMPYGVIWLQRAEEADIVARNPEYSGLLGRSNQLLFAYALDLPTQFAQISWQILLMHCQLLKYETQHGLELPIPPDHDLLRHDLNGELARRKARLRRDIQAALMDPVSQVTRQLSSHGRGSEIHPTCPNAALAIGNYMALLERFNLSPWRPQFETDSFSAIITRALEVAQSARDDPYLFFQMCSRHRCACDNIRYGQQVHLAKKLLHNLETAWDWKLWACLDCLKNRREDDLKDGEEEERKCRVKHW